MGTCAITSALPPRSTASVPNLSWILSATTEEIDGMHWSCRLNTRLGSASRFLFVSSFGGAVPGGAPPGRSPL